MKNFIKINNPEYFLLLFFGFIYYFFVLYDNHISLNFNYQYYLYDYNFGFIKRGLIGSICNLLFSKVSEYTFVLIATVILVILGISIVKIIDSINFKNKFYGYFLVSLLAICPALLKNLWYDLGRLDIFGILYCLFFLYPFKKRLLNIFLLLSPLILLIHEGFFLLWLPTYFVCWFIRKNMILIKNDKIISITFISISVLVLFLVCHFGKLNIPFPMFKSYLKSKSNDINNFDTSVIAGDTYLYKQVYSSIILNFTHIKFWFLGLINLFSIGYIIVILCRLLGINYKKYRIIYLPTVLTFIMFFLGCDALRWFSNMCISLYILLLCILVTNKDNISERKIIDKNLSNDIYFLIFILLAMMPLKKLGVLWW